MLKIKVNNKFNFELSSELNQTVINGLPFHGDILKINSRSFHVLYNNKSFNAELIDFDKEQKTCSVKVGNTVYSMQMTDQFDELLHQLGMDNLTTATISEIKGEKVDVEIKIFGRNTAVELTLNQIEKI